MIPRHFGGTTAASSNMIDLLGGFALATKYLETHSMPHHVSQDDNNRSPNGTNAGKKWKGGIWLWDHIGVDNCLCVPVGLRGKYNPDLSSFHREEAILFFSLLFNHLTYARWVTIIPKFQRLVIKRVGEIELKKEQNRSRGIRTMGNLQKEPFLNLRHHLGIGDKILLSFDFQNLTNV